MQCVWIAILGYLCSCYKHQTKQTLALLIRHSQARATCERIGTIREELQSNSRMKNGLPFFRSFFLAKREYLAWGRLWVRTKRTMIRYPVGRGLAPAASAMCNN